MRSFSLLPQTPEVLREKKTKKTTTKKQQQQQQQNSNINTFKHGFIRYYYLTQLKWVQIKLLILLL